MPVHSQDTHVHSYSKWQNKWLVTQVRYSPCRWTRQWWWIHVHSFTPCDKPDDWLLTSTLTPCDKTSDWSLMSTIVPAGGQDKEGAWGEAEGCRWHWDEHQECGGGGHAHAAHVAGRPLHLGHQQCLLQSQHRTGLVRTGRVSLKQVQLVCVQGYSRNYCIFPAEAPFCLLQGG